MPRRTGIRWKAGEKEEVTREIRRYNERRRRAIKRNPDLINTIPTMPPKGTIKNITTRQELKNLQAQLKISAKKGAFELVKVGNIKITRYELEMQKRRLRQLNAKRAWSRIKSGVKIGEGTMGTIEQNALRKREFSKPRSRKEWDLFVDSIEKQLSPNYDDEKSKRYRENYYAAFVETYGVQDALWLMEYLSRLSHQEIVDAMYKNPILNIEFLYSDREEWDGEHLDDVKQAWENYLKSIGKL